MIRFLTAKIITIQICSYCLANICKCNRVFHKLHQNVNIAFSSLLSDKMLPLVGIEPGPLKTSDSKSNSLPTEITRPVLLIRSLTFCSCTTWCLDLDDLARINRAWLYKEPKVSVLQANAKWVQKGECWTWNQRLWEAQVQFSLGVTFYNWIFLFSRSKDKMIILTFPCNFWKTRIY